VNRIIKPGEIVPSNSNRISKLEHQFMAQSSLTVNMGKLIGIFESRINELEDRINQQTKENKGEQEKK